MSAKEILVRWTMVESRIYGKAKPATMIYKPVFSTDDSAVCLHHWQTCEIVEDKCPDNPMRGYLKVQPRSCDVCTCLSFIELPEHWSWNVDYETMCDDEDRAVEFKLPDGGRNMTTNMIQASVRAAIARHNDKVDKMTYEERLQRWIEAVKEPPPDWFPSPPVEPPRPIQPPEAVVSTTSLPFRLYCGRGIILPQKRYKGGFGRCNVEVWVPIRPTDFIPDGVFIEEDWRRAEQLIKEWYDYDRALEHWVKHSMRLYRYEFRDFMAAVRLLPWRQRLNFLPVCDESFNDVRPKMGEI